MLHRLGIHPRFAVAHPADAISNPNLFGGWIACDLGKSACVERICRQVGARANESSLAKPAIRNLPESFRSGSDSNRIEVITRNVVRRGSRVKKSMMKFGFVFLAAGMMSAVHQQAKAETGPYPAMASLDEYLMPRDAEIALARSAAPASISDQATIMVLGKQGYETAAQGTNGFLCYVERSWAQEVNAAEFWNPKMRAPNCFNQAAAMSIAQLYLMKTRLVLEGKSKAEIAQTLASALDNGEVPAVPPGGMCYMMSKEQYLNDDGKSWHPHVMFYVAGDAAQSWGANQQGSPIIAANDTEARVTIMMVVVRHWSDGTLNQN